MDPPHVDTVPTQKHGLQVGRHEVSQPGVGRGGERCGHEPTLTIRPPQKGQIRRTNRIAVCEWTRRTRRKCETRSSA